MKKHKWGFFPFDAMDYKAAQAYLDKKADEGWVLDKLILKYFARFDPAEGRYHCVDLDLHGALDDGPDPDYLQLCEDAGWELVKRPRGMLLFRSLPGQRPAPLQTDAGMEADRFWKKYMRRNLLIYVSALLLLLLYCAVLFSLPHGTPSFSSLVLSNVGLLYSLGAILVVLLFLWQGGVALIRFFRWRRSGVLSDRGYRSALVRGILGVTITVLCIAGFFLRLVELFEPFKTVDVMTNSYTKEDTATWETCEAYPILLSTDLGLEWEDSFSRSLEGQRSLLVDSLTYSEQVDAEGASFYIFTTDRYECVGEAVARWLLSALLEETARSSNYPRPELTWFQASGLGFDESWATPGACYLLLRQGNTVALVGATGFDLTAPDYLDTLHQRLFADQ